MKRLGSLVLIVATSLLISGCGTSGGDGDVVEQGAKQDAPAGTAPSDDASPAETEQADDEQADDEQGQLVEYGFGQDGDYATAVALVENTSDHGGQTVTVSVNFLNDAGDIVATESQVDSFNTPGQTIASQISADVTGEKIASIQPTLLIEDDSIFEESDVDLGVVEATKIKKEYGSYSATFMITNPTDDALESPAVRVACRDAAGVINGGGFTFPDLLAPNGQIVTDVSLTVGSEPKSCTAYVGGPIF